MAVIRYIYSDVELVRRCPTFQFRFAIRREPKSPTADIMASRTIFRKLRPPTMNLAKMHCSAHTVALEPFGEETAAALVREGFAVHDNALTSPVTTHLRSEIDLLVAGGSMSQNATHFVSPAGDAVSLLKRGVLEAELHTLSASVRAELPALVSIEQDASSCALLSVLQPRLTLREQSVKAVLGGGDGACFPMHADSARSVDARVATALLYLNEEHSPADGGALRVYPFPRPPVNIDPLPGRMVLLSATGMLHRVLPARKPRYSLTVWLSGKVRPYPPGTRKADSMDDDELVCNRLLSPNVRPLVARVALADEWDQSLRDAHAPKEAEAALAQHASDRKTIVERLPAQVAKAVEGDDARADRVKLRVQELLREPEELTKILCAYADETDGQWL